MKKGRLIIVAFFSLLMVTANVLAQSPEPEKTKAELKQEKKAHKKATKAEKKAQTAAARAAARDYGRYTSLAEILRQQPGVLVKGSNQNAIIEIRGINSIQLDTRPLFVFDGIELGRDYAKVNNAIDRTTIKSIRVLRNLSELNYYGERGRNGVILIRSKK